MEVSALLSIQIQGINGAQCIPKNGLREVLLKVIIFLKES